MSVSYSIDVTLDLLYTEENIKHILSLGQNNHFTYFDYEWDSTLSIDETIQKILYSDYENRNMHVRFQDTIFCVWFFKSDDGLLIFSIGSFGYKWDKDFSNGRKISLIDFARYIRLLLEVVQNIAILELSTVSDTTEELVYKYKNCVVVVFDMGFYQKNILGDIDCAKWSIESFIDNGIQNRFEFFDEHTNLLIKPHIQQYYEMLKTNYSTYLYAKKEHIKFKIEIVRTGQGYDCVALYPLEPYRIKKGYGSEGGKFDVAFYVQCLLELCENFAIYELKTFF